jgi:hypothetical protein
MAARIFRRFYIPADRLFVLGRLRIPVTRLVQRLLGGLFGRLFIPAGRLLRRLSEQSFGRLFWRFRHQPIPHSPCSWHMTPNSVTDPAPRGGKNPCNRGVTSPR